MTSTREDYRTFYAKPPSQKNPTDINTKEKFEFAVSIGWTRLRATQTARKAGLDFSKRSYWYNV